MKMEGLTPTKGAGLQDVNVVTFSSLLPFQLLLSGEVKNIFYSHNRSFKIRLTGHSPIVTLL